MSADGQSVAFWASEAIKKVPLGGGPVSVLASRITFQPFGLAWDDPGLGIGWPNREPVTSERDRSNPRLAEIADAPRFDA